MAKCPACGSSAFFDVRLQKLKCPNCDNIYSPEETEHVQHAGETEMFGMTVFTCPNCGGELYSTDNDMTGICSYCGSDVVFESRLEQGERPKKILPFQKTKEDCKELFMETVKKDFFAPPELKDPEFIDSFRGIYMPYWITRIHHYGTVNTHGTKKYISGSYSVKEDWQLNFQLDAVYNDFVHDASSSFSDDISERVEPYNLHGTSGNENACKPFYPAYLSGFYAETADVEERVYDPSFREAAEKKTEDYIRTNPKIAGYSLDTLGPAGAVAGGYQEETMENVPALFPVWFMSYRKHDRVAYMTVNGQTGRVTADLPISIGQCLKAAALLFVIFAAAFYMITLRPISIGVLSVWFSAVVLAMNADELNVAKEHSRKTIVHRKRKSISNRAAKTGWIGIIIILLVAGTLKAIGDDDPALAVATEDNYMRVYAMVGFALVIVMFIRCMIRWAKLEREDRVSPWFIMAAVCAVMAASCVLVDPSNDMIYYGICSLDLIALTLAVFGMILNFNKIVTQPLPQFEHKGGDDRA